MALRLKFLVPFLAVGLKTALGGYGSWAAASGVAGEASSDDADRDGLVNLLEYALGSDPLAHTAIPQPGLPARVVFPRGHDAIQSGDIAWEIQVSESMDTGIWWAVDPDFEADGSISYALPDDAPRWFVRLAVSRTLHPAAASYASVTTLAGDPLWEVSALLHELEDAGIVPDFLFLAGDRYQARSGNRVQAVIGGAGTIAGTIGGEDRAMVFDGSASWIEFENPARSTALGDYALFAVASADSTVDQSLVASSHGGASERGCRLMFNGSSSWGAMPGRVAADGNRGTGSEPSGWNTSTRIHAGGQLLPVAMHYSSATVIPRGDLPLPSPRPLITVSAGITRSSAAVAPLGPTVWNDAAKFRVGANLTGDASHQGQIAMVMVARTPTFPEETYQLMATAPVRAGVVPRFGPEVFAVFDGDSVTEGAGSPGADYGSWSWPAQLFGGHQDQAAGGQWSGRFNGRNIAVGGRALASNEAAWQHTTRFMLNRPEWGARYYFTMMSHNQTSQNGLPPMAHPESLRRLEAIWRQAKALGAIPVCVGLVSGQRTSEAAVAEYEAGYGAVRALAESCAVPLVDVAEISQLRAGEFGSGPEWFYADIIHPTEKGYRLIAQEVAAALPFPGSAAPRSLERPSLGGDPLVDSPMTCSQGTWEHNPVLIRHQWMREGSDIDGATGFDYVPQDADQGKKLSCRVSAWNAEGGAERTSSHSHPIAAP